MATARLVEVDNAGQNEYDRVVGLSKLLTDTPKGLVAHFAGPVTGGWRVFDIWDSEQAIRDYEHARLLPALQKSGVNIKPRTELLPLHNVQVVDRANLARLRDISAVGLIVDTPGMTERQYDRLLEVLTFGVEPAEGMILHASGPGKNGWQVFDIWRNEEAFQDFLRDRLTPGFKKAGITSEARPLFFPIYSARIVNPGVLDEIGITRPRA